MKIHNYSPQDLESLTRAINTFKQENDKKKLYFPEEYVDISVYRKKHLGIDDVIIATENNEIKGFAIGHPKENNSRHTYWLKIVYVVPESRGKDIAKELIQKALEIASYRGYKRVQDKIAKENHSSLKLHDKLRFSRGRYESKNRQDAENFYLMTKSLRY